MNSIHHKIDSINSHWILENINDQDLLSRYFRFTNYDTCISFTMQVANLAETSNHHPEITLKYNEVIIRTYTHDNNSISDDDFNLAKDIDNLYIQFIDSFLT